MKKQKLWEEWEIDYLKDNYDTLDLSSIMSKLGRTKSSITNKASKLGVRSGRNRLSDLSNLLQEKPEAYYWIGFLMADGHFSKRGQLQINLSQKDLAHLKKFAKFINYEKDLVKPNLHVCDVRCLSKVIEKFDLKNDKTYNPPNLTIEDNDLFFSLVIGFIDGDGTFDKNGYLRIKVHNNWTNIISDMMKTITQNSEYGLSVDSRNLVTGYVTKIETIKNIKKRVLGLELPILNRKWDRVNLNKLSKKERREKLDNICFVLFDKDKTPIDIIKETGISSSFVYSSLKRYENEKIRK